MKARLHVRCGTRRGRPAMRRRTARGAVLYVALVVLVAMALAALALLRSVDVVGLVAANLSFKRSALGATDLGTAQATAMFNTLNTNDGLTADASALCYSASLLATDSRGVPSVLTDMGSFASGYPNCSSSITATGETVSWLIERQCQSAGVGTGTPSATSSNLCALASRQGVGTAAHSPASVGTSRPLYRITVRTDGPRGSVSIVQTVLAPTRG